MKSQVATEAVKVMNPNMQIKAYVDGVLPETEHIYNDEFFERLDGVVNALDNVKARKNFLMQIKLTNTDKILFHQRRKKKIYPISLSLGYHYICFFFKVNILIVVVFIIKNH